MFHVSAEKLLPAFEHPEFTGMAYDGSNFYFTSGERYIYTLNMSGEWEQPLQTRRTYHSICFDTEKSCFWATSHATPGYVYQLATNFRERGRMILRCRNYRPGQISAIALAPEKNRLLCLCSGHLYTADMNGYSERFEVEELEESLSTCAQVTASRLYISSLHKEKDSLEIHTFSLEDGMLLHALDLSEQITQALFTTQYEENEQKIFVFGRGTDNQYSIYEYVNENTELLAASVSADMDQLVYKIMPELAGTQVNSRGKNCTHKCCPPTCCKKSCECACVGVLESIALVECSIAHILNAEGEKLQKAICKANCIEELLAINHSVKETVIHSLHLEQVLYSKLEAVLEQCPNDTKIKCK